MNYNIYKVIADKFVIDKTGTTDVLKTYDKNLQDEVYNYMLKTVLEECDSNASDIQNSIQEHKRLFERYMNNYKKS